MKRFRKPIAFSLSLVALVSGAAIAAQGNSFMATGQDVITYSVASIMGGVVLQGQSEFVDEQGNAIAPTQLQLNTSPNTPSKVCLMFSASCYELGVQPETAFALSKWILTEQTGAYTFFEPDGTHESSVRFVEVQDMAGHFNEGYAASELIRGAIPEVLHFLDFELLLTEIDDDAIKDKYNRKNGFDANFDPQAYESWEGAYINTDTDVSFVASLTNGKVDVSGTIDRFFWEKYDEFEEIYITEVQKACTPESVQSYNTQDCSALTDFGYVYTSWNSQIEPDSYVGLYLVTGSTVDAALNPSTDEKGGNIFLSLPAANAESYKGLAKDERFPEAWQFNPIKVARDEARLRLNWEDVPTGGDRDFNDFVINVSGLSNPSESATGIFQLDAEYSAFGSIDFDIEEKNSVAISGFGFFEVDGPDGRIGQLMPNDPGYVNAALNQRRRHTVISYEAIQSEIATYYPHQQKAISLLQTAAVIRRLANEHPQALTAFVEQDTI